ncbi:MAG: MATE family efflux transporter [Thermoguttaceae bacterium]|nr:MATE family efflux transporter [Thermoguttaceae bacterium]
MTPDSKLFLRYVIPSMASMLIAGSFCIVDTIFIGQGLGELGLAAVGISWPIVMFFSAAADMIGCGAAVLISQARGANEPNDAQKSFQNMVWLQCVVTLVLTVLILLELKPIMYCMGINEELMPIGFEYIRIMVLYSFVGVFMMGGVAVIRNDGHPVLAMLMEIIGLSMNILLDWAFIIHWRFGASGAAWATICSQIVACLIAFWYFLSPHTNLRFTWGCFVPDWRRIREILVTGIPIFGNSLIILVMLAMHNYQSLRYGGKEGLAAYTLLSSIEALGSLLMTGLGTGVQPMVAFLHGAREHKRKAHIGKMGIQTAFGIGILIFLVSLILKDYMPGWTGLSGETAKLASHGVMISLSAFLLLGVIRVASYYYQATEQIVQANILIYGDACFALPLCLFVLPLWLGIDGVWWAMPASRVILFVILCGLWKYRINHPQVLLKD